MLSLFISNSEESIRRVYAGMEGRLEQEAGLVKGLILNQNNLKACKDQAAQADYLFSTWGMLPLSKEEIQAYFPNLKGIFYGAGTVQYFARPFLELGVRIFSAWAANAVPVAEFTLSQILLANKGFFQSARLFSSQGHTKAREFFSHFGGNYGAKVGILGAGMIGKLVIQKLKDYSVEVTVFDPFLPDETAQALGVAKAPLEEVFRTSQVISNHLANNPQTAGMIDRKCLSLMQDYATFINTGRGAQVVEKDLAAALEQNPTLTAVLDVTDPEPPLPDSPLYRLPNVFLTPHTAGSAGFEVQRMGAYMLQEFLAVRDGGCPQYEVTLPMLETMA
jgi:phosphoglycerate dehydrogenase-like enzyme